MTEEKLRLEIQLEVQKALSNLKSVSQDLKRLSQDVKNLSPSTEQTKRILENLNDELKTSSSMASLFEDELGGLREEQELLKSAIRSLIQQGLSPQSEEVQKLKTQYEEAGKRMEKLGGKASGLQGELGKLIDAMGAAATAAKLTSFALQAVAAFNQAEIAAQRLSIVMEMRGSRDGAKRLSEFASQIQNLTGVSDDLVKQLAAELAAQGKSEDQIKELITAAANLSAVTGDDLSTSVRELSNTYSGMVGYIGRSIPALKDLTEEQLKSGEAVRLVSSLYAGYAERLQGTGEVSFRRMREAVGDLMEAIGEGLAPILRMGANLIAQIASAAAQAGPILKGVMGAAVAALAAGFTVLAAKATLSAAAHWSKFAALMAVNKAMAALNPLMWAGIAAATAGVITLVAYARSQSEAARAITETESASKSASVAYRDTAQAVDQARAALDAYKTSLRDKSLEELSATLATLKARLAQYMSEAVKDFQTRKLSSETAAQIAIVEDLIQAKKNEIASKWKQQWTETYERFKAQSSGDAYAEIEYERKKKLEEAAANYIGKLNQRTIDEINDYYNAKRRQVAESIAQAEREQLARITQTRVDDLELERDRALASFKGSEEARARIADYYAEQIARTRREEEQKAARERIEQELKAAEFEARLTETRVDDLQAQMNRELALFEGTEEQKARLAAWYAEQIRKTEEDEAKKAAETQIQEAKRAFEESRALADKEGKWGVYAVQTFQAQAAPTEVGKMAGFAGSVSVDPISMAIEAMVEFALSIENVQKVLNPFKTILEGARELLEPLINDALQPIVDVLLEIGRAFAQTLAPFISQAALLLRILSTSLQITIIPARLIGRAFEWLNNQVIVPFGNAIINLVNGVIRAINWVLGWAGVDIPYLERLKTTDQIAQEEEEIKKKMEQISDEMDRVRDVFAQRRKDVEDAYQKNIQSLRKLLELGAMGEEEYAAKVAAANAQKASELAVLEAAERSQLSELQKIYDKLSNGINVTVTNIPGAQQGATSQASSAGSSLGSSLATVAGTAIGAALGTFFGPVGTAVGAAIGSQSGSYIEKAGDFVGDSVRKGAKTVRKGAKTAGNALKKLKFWDVGTIEVPADMLSVVHKGEMIVPATFAESIRRGELSLGARASGPTEILNVTVHVAGSVKTEEDILDAIALGIERRRKRNLLPAGA